MHFYVQKLLSNNNSTYILLVKIYYLHAYLWEFQRGGFTDGGGPKMFLMKWKYLLQNSWHENKILVSICTVTVFKKSPLPCLVG